MTAPTIRCSKLAQGIRQGLRRNGLARPALALALLGAGFTAQAAPVAVNIPAQSLTAALNEFARQTGVQLVYSADSLFGLRSHAVATTAEPADSLGVLLQGSGVRYQVDNGMITLTPAPSVGRDVVELGAVTISGKAPGSTTEGTGSYTTESSSSSTRLNLTPAETPQTVTVLTRQRLDDQRLENVTDALDATPGITVVREGVGADTDAFYSRGFAINNYEIDGVPTSSSLATYRLSTAMYDRVEIVRGATGLISGLGTPSATINLIRKRPTKDFQFSATGQAGSWDRYGTGFDVSGPLNDAGNVRGRLVADYKNQHSWVDRFQQETGTLYGITEFDLSEDTLLTLGFSHLTDNVDSPLRNGFPLFYSNGQRFDFKRSANNAPDWSYFDNQIDNVFASVEHHFSHGWSGKLEFNHTEYKYDGTVAYLNNTGIDQATGAGTSISAPHWKAQPQQDSVDAYLTGPFSLFGREHELIAGVTLSQFSEQNTNQYNGSSWVDTGPIPDINHWDGHTAAPVFTKTGESDTREYQYAAYLTSRFHLNDDLSLILGSRVLDWKRGIDTSSLDGTKSKAQNRESGVFIPYAGLVYALDDTWSIYTSYTKIFNPQGYWVRDANNQPLEPEEGTSYEAGIKGSFNDGLLTGSLAVFKTEQDNYANLDPNTYVYTSEQGFTTKGLELELNGELATGWQVAAGYAYALTEDSDDRRQVTQVPRNSVKTFTTYRLPGQFDKFTVGGGFDWQSKTGYNLSNYSQGSYTLVNLMTRYDINDHLSATVNLNNVFDKEYFSSASAYGVYGAPRNLMTTLKYTY
ncbi:TonB-dependent receptor [Pseudomonas sp. RIT-PI-S]|uniref:TonB-dependent siderophore receptor n=1 Tax=Pseudomonas sp. RIT-PI-S TaxID=3035295 RepID=UPI0021DA7B68|nr:TonB-dependent receptor [Pseudomonas sp. RIT-PI-S]